MKYSRNKKNGFTMIELLVALMISSIILSAIATLTYAISHATKGSEDIGDKQARIRFAQVRLKELIRNSKMICSSTSSDIAIWTADSDNDNQIDTGELVYIDCGSSNDNISIIEFTNTVGSNIRISQLEIGTVKGWLISNNLKSNTAILENCQNVSFSFDTQPPRSSLVTIKFEYAGLDSISKYEISSKLICQSQYLLDSSDELYVLDDD